MDSFDFDFVAPSVREIKLEQKDVIPSNKAAIQDIEQLEKELEQAKQKVLALRQQDQPNEAFSSNEPKSQVSESRYWTNEERQRFKKALKMFGTDFASIAKFVGTRSSTQVRTHAQKYYAKLIRDYKRSTKAQGATKDKNPLACRIQL